MEFLMGIFNKIFGKKSPQPSENDGPTRINNEPWPLSPPKHAEDLHYQMNEYNVFGIYCFIGTDSKVLTQVREVNYYAVVLMENGYGERYANIIKDGLIVTNYDATERVRKSEDWTYKIKPWLENRTDHIPLQDGIVAAELGQQIFKMREQIEKNKQT